MNVISINKRLQRIHAELLLQQQQQISDPRFTGIHVFPGRTVITDGVAVIVEENAYTGTPVVLDFGSKKNFWSMQEDDCLTIGMSDTTVQDGQIIGWSSPTDLKRSFRSKYGRDLEVGIATVSLLDVEPAFRAAPISSDDSFLAVSFDIALLRTVAAALGDGHLVVRVPTRDGTQDLEAPMYVERMGSTSKAIVMATAIEQSDLPVSRIGVQPRPLMPDDGELVDKMRALLEHVEMLKQEVQTLYDEIDNAYEDGFKAGSSQ